MPEKEALLRVCSYRIDLSACRHLLTLYLLPCGFAVSNHISVYVGNTVSACESPFRGGAHSRKFVLRLRGLLVAQDG